MAYRIYLAECVYYGLGKPLTKSYRDVRYPPEDVDVEAITEDIVKKTGITLI